MNYSFDSGHAVAYGVDEAIMLSNIIFWIRKNKVNGKHLHDGRTWTYNSASAFADLFPFWNEKQVRRIIDSLLNQGVIVAGTYNKSKMDRTRWFAVVCEEMLDLPIREDATSDTGTPIPDSKHTDSKPIPNVIDKSITTDGSEAPTKVGKPAPKKVGPADGKCTTDILLESFFTQANELGSPMRRLNRLQIRKQIIEIIKAGIPVDDIGNAIDYLFSKHNADQGQYMVKLYRADQLTPDKINQLMMKVDEIALKKQPTKAGIIEGAGKRI